MVKRRASGHALMVAIIVVLIVGSAAALLFTHHSLQTRLVHQQSRRIHLTALNDAALAEALAGLAASRIFRGSAPHPFGDGEINSRVRSIGENRREIVASASYRGWSRRTRVEVTLGPGGPWVDRWAVIRGGNAD